MSIWFKWIILWINISVIKNNNNNFLYIYIILYNFINFLYIVQVRNFCSTTEQTPTPTKTTNTNNTSIVDWNEQKVEKWFLNTKYKDFASKFKFLNGKELSELIEAQFKSVIEDV